MANSTQGLQNLLSSLQSESGKGGLTINKKNTKIMVLSIRTKIPCSNIFLDGEKLDQINQFNYLGSLITLDCRCDKEIRRRIVLAKKAFTEKRTILADKKLSIKLRLRTLLYGCESWTISSNCRKRLDALELWCYRKMMRLSYMVGMERSLLNTIRRRELRFVGHVMRTGGLEKLVLEGKINGRQRLKYLEGLALTAGCGAVDILRWAGDCAGFRHMTANIRP